MVRVARARACEEGGADRLLHVPHSHHRQQRKRDLHTHPNHVSLRLLHTGRECTRGIRLANVAPVAPWPDLRDASSRLAHERGLKQTFLLSSLEGHN